MHAWYGGREAGEEGGRGEEGHRRPNQTKAGCQTKHNQKVRPLILIGGGPDCFLIILISVIAMDVVVFRAGAMPCHARHEA